MARMNWREKYRQHFAERQIPDPAPDFPGDHGHEDCLLNEQRLDKIRRLHEPVQWRGISMFVQRLRRSPLVDVERWCVECRQPYPCQTVRVLDATRWIDINLVDFSA